MCVRIKATSILLLCKHNIDIHFTFTALDEWTHTHSCPYTSTVCQMAASIVHYADASDAIHNWKCV